MADYIITSLQSWDIEIGSTIKNTAWEISQTNRVLYVNPPIDIATYIRMRYRHRTTTPTTDRRLAVLRKETPALRQISPNLWVLDCPFVIHSVGQLPNFLFDYLNRKNCLKIARWITVHAVKLGFENEIHLIDTDLFRSLHLKEYLHSSISIYYRRDYVIGFPYWRKQGPRCEEQLVRQSDIVLTNSTYFADQLRPWNRQTYAINTGVNLELYDASITFERPQDLSPISAPIIGYTGAIIESRLDSQLLYEAAVRLSRCQFVLVGPEDEHFQKHPLHTLPNVQFLGRKEVAELPSYIQHFDICINPQKVNPITDGNYPLKIDEYLAMGKPVVATRTHTMEDVFASHTHLASSIEEWIPAIENALAECNDNELAAKRIAFAHTHSWKCSVEQIYQAIRSYSSSGMSAR